QTSESSRRDFALRKGAPVVVKSTTPDKDSLRQLMVFRLSRGGDKSGTKKLTKSSAQSPEATSKMLFSSQRLVKSSDQVASYGLVHPDHPSQPKKGVRFNPDRS